MKIELNFMPSLNILVTETWTNGEKKNGVMEALEDSIVIDERLQKTLVVV